MFIVTSHYFWSQAVFIGAEGKMRRKAKSKANRNIFKILLTADISGMTEEQQYLTDERYAFWWEMLRSRKKPLLSYPNYQWFVRPREDLQGGH